MDVSEESLLEYFYRTGGKVKNGDLLKTYKPFIGHIDMQLRAKYREEFKLIIDRIAVVKSENGEKYLVLKKRYRQLLNERDTEHHGTDREGQGSPARTSATVQWEGTGVESPSTLQRDFQSSDIGLDLSPAPSPGPSPSSSQGAQQRRPVQVMWCGSPSITVTEAPEMEDTQEEQHTERTTSPLILKEAPALQFGEPLAPSNGEDELDKDSGSKSESEQEEECMGSMGSTAVALDPVEKEWIYSAACGRLSDLSQLLKQDPSLANKKDFTSGFTALHWAAKHGKEDMATLMAKAGADVNTKSHGGYTPLHIAALHGHNHILDLLIGTYGAKENLRDYSGHLACYYLNISDTTTGVTEQFHVAQARERRNRKLGSLFHSKKKWGSAEELGPIEEERASPHQLMIPAFRPRKFSR